MSVREEMKASTSLRKFKCECEDPGSCAISPFASGIMGGVKSIVDLDNVQVGSGKVICQGCKRVIYEEEK